MIWIVTSYENMDKEHLRDIQSFPSREEALKWRNKDLNFYGHGSYEFCTTDAEEE